MTAAYVFFGFLALLFAFSAVISLPLEKPVDLAREGIGGLQGQRGRWYTLREGTYSVGPDLGSIHIRSSFLMFRSREYTYYCATINPDSEEAFSMPIRVRADKRQELESGKAVVLYGMASELTGSLRSKLEETAQSERLSYLCLNDNGDTAVTRGLSSVVFAVFAGMCVFMIVRLLKR